MRTKFKNALELIQSLPEENQEYCYDRLYDQPTHDMVEQILELAKPEDFESLVKESYEASK